MTIHLGRGEEYRAGKFTAVAYWPQLFQSLREVHYIVKLNDGNIEGSAVFRHLFWTLTPFEATILPGSAGSHNLLLLLDAIRLLSTEQVDCCVIYPYHSNLLICLRGIRAQNSFL